MEAWSSVDDVYLANTSGNISKELVKDLINRVTDYLQISPSPDPAPKEVTFDSAIDFLKQQKKEQEKQTARADKLAKENKDVKDENTQLKEENKQLKDEIAKMKRETSNIKTEDDFVRRMVEETKESCEGSPDDAKPIAQMLQDLGRRKEAKELRQWIKEEKRSLNNVNIDKVNDIHDNQVVKASLYSN